MNLLWCLKRVCKCFCIFMSHVVTVEAFLVFVTLKLVWHHIKTLFYPDWQWTNVSVSATVHVCPLLSFTRHMTGQRLDNQMITSWSVQRPSGDPSASRASEIISEMCENAGRSSALWTQYTDNSRNVTKHACKDTKTLLVCLLWKILRL